MPLLEIHLTLLWHKSDIDLVGNYYLFELCSGAWKIGQIIDTEYSMPTATLLWKR